MTEARAAKPSLEALERQAASRPDDPAAWRALADRRRLAGDAVRADQAYAREIRASLLSDPELLRAAEALCAGQGGPAQRIAAERLARRPDDPGALRLMGEIAYRTGRDREAERLLARCAELAPGFASARYAYAMALHRVEKPQATLAETDKLLAEDPGNPIYRHLRAAALAALGRNADSVEAYGDVLADFPDEPLTWTVYGHGLKTVGRQAEAVAAYRWAIALRPGLGEAWWSLANLKTVGFDAADRALMARELARGDLGFSDRLHLEFALGKALEDEGADEAAFRHYAAGNALMRQAQPYDPEETTLQMRRTKALMGSRFFAQRSGQGAPRPDPIFIVGLPRSGSTLVEQILASHSQVEGTQELPDIISIAQRLGGPARKMSESAYPEALAALTPAELAVLGEEYLARTRPLRLLGRPFFIDKMPNNFAHSGLIHLILPNAKIIDVRRHPMGCCFSGFKQLFAQGQAFTYGLADIGRYYRDYVELMAHFDAVLPGRIHRVIYEALVAEPETEVRRLLDHCGLPFEAACLRFYENDRAVRTASSEQVRRPIFTDATDHWRRFEAWLGPLKASLGPVLEAYPAAPSV